MCYKMATSVFRIVPKEVVAKILSSTKCLRKVLTN